MEDNKLINNPAFLFGSICVLCIIAVITIAYIEVRGLQPSNEDKAIQALDSLNANLSALSADNERTRQQIARNDTIIAEIEAQNARMRELLKRIEK